VNQFAVISSYILFETFSDSLTIWLCVSIITYGKQNVHRKEEGWAWQVLVGESLVKQDDPCAAIAGLYGKDISRKMNNEVTLPVAWVLLHQLSKCHSWSVCKIKSISLHWSQLADLRSSMHTGSTWGKRFSKDNMILTTTVVSGFLLEKKRNRELPFVTFSLLYLCQICTISSWRLYC
jgi:hypothetical protein